MASERLPALPELRPLYLRGALGLVGRHGDSLPERELLVEDVRIDPDRLAAYDRVCGYRLGDEVPATYLQVLAFPLQVAQMAERAFPFPLPGLVHIRNSITVVRPVHLAAALTFRVHAERLLPHRKGAQVDLVSRADVEGETVWFGRSTYLAPGRSVARPADEHDTEVLPREELGVPHRTAAVIRVPRDLGRRYAKVSGDVNPIHLGRLRARLFGFKRPIAHGMWTKARCLAALEGRLPSTYTVDVEFRKPVHLPGTVEFASARREDGWSFGLRSPSGSPHLLGRVRA